MRPARQSDLEPGEVGLLRRLGLLAHAAGSPQHSLNKVRRLTGSLLRMTSPRIVRARIDSLAALGYVTEPVSATQLALCAVDMFRFWVKDPSPEAIAFYGRTGMSWPFHQLLRWLQEPAAMIDPLGLFSAPSVVIAHLLQVVHANPWYDLQLLHSHDALDALEAALLQVLDGTHPDAATIALVIEDGDYHQALLAQLRAFRQSPRLPPPLRTEMDPPFRLAEETFGELSAALAYAARLPATRLAALRHLASVSELWASPALAPHLRPLAGTVRAATHGARA